MYLKERVKNLIISARDYRGPFRGVIISAGNYRGPLAVFLRDEKGSSLVEFALVLPMLIVLTVGGIYMSVSFGQKSILNGVNFMDVRAGSVRKDPEISARKAKELYVAQAEGKQKWLEKAEVHPQKMTGKANNGMTDFRVELAKDGMRIDLLINSLSILSGKKPDHSIRQLVSNMTLPMEYVTHKTASGSVSDHSETYSVVDYETKSVVDDTVDKLLKGLSPETAEKIKGKIFKKMVDPKKGGPGHDSSRADRILGTNATENMINLKSTLEGWGLEFKYNPNDYEPASEAPKIENWLTDGINPENLYFLQAVGERVKTVETTAKALQAISTFMFGPVGGIYAVLGQISTEAAKMVETAGDGIGIAAEKHNTAIFFDKPDFGGR